MHNISTIIIHDCSSGAVGLGLGDDDKVGLGDTVISGASVEDEKIIVGNGPRAIRETA